MNDAPADSLTDGTGDARPAAALTGFRRLSQRLLDQRFLWLPFAVVMAFYAARYLYAFGLRLAQWDLLLLSGFATLIFGLSVVRAIPERMRLTIKRLSDRKVLDLSPARLEAFLERLEERSLRWAMVGGPVAALAITAAFFGAFDRVSLQARIPLIIIEALAGYVAGLHLGRMASYGALGPFLKQSGLSIRAWPGHIDGAAGLKPVGDFYFFQAMVAAIPAMFLAAWWVLIPLFGERYAYWRDPYLAQLAVAVALEALAFVVPLLWFHREMMKAKVNLLQQADRLSMEMLESTDDSGEAQADGDKLNLEQAGLKYAAIEDMPTWPVDVRTKRRFSRNNIALVLPLLGHAVGQTNLARQLSGILRGLS